MLAGSSWYLHGIHSWYIVWFVAFLWVAVKSIDAFGDWLNTEIIQNNQKPKLFISSLT